MDLLKLIRSFEEFLFEAMAWLVYYPRTMWLIFRHPLRMMDYSDHEQRDAEDEQYTDTLSPPLLLFLTIAFGHALALGAGTPGTDAETEAGALFGSHENLVIVRSLVFAVLPLTAALAYARRTAPTLERKYLRPPFFGQCYLAAAYALAIAIGALAVRAAERPVAIAGGALLAIATIAYLSAQTAQFRRSLAIGWLRAFGLALRVYLEAILIVLVAGLLLIGG